MYCKHNGTCTLASWSCQYVFNLHSGSHHISAEALVQSVVLQAVVRTNGLLKSSLTKPILFYMVTDLSHSKWSWTNFGPSYDGKMNTTIWPELFEVLMTVEWISTDLPGGLIYGSGPFVATISIIGPPSDPGSWNLLYYLKCIFFCHVGSTMQVNWGSLLMNSLTLSLCLQVLFVCKSLSVRISPSFCCQMKIQKGQFRGMRHRFPNFWKKYPYIAQRSLHFLGWST